MLDRRELMAAAIGSIPMLMGVKKESGIVGQPVFDEQVEQIDSVVFSSENLGRVFAYHAVRVFSENGKVTTNLYKNGELIKVSVKETLNPCKQAFGMQSWSATYPHYLFEE